MIDQEEIVERRRELVRHWVMMGVSIPAIIDHLARHDEHSFLDPTLRYRQKHKVIEADIECIQVDLRRKFYDGDTDVRAAHAEYLARSEYLYSLAMQQGNIPLAQSINKDISRAKGVEVDAKINVGGDLLSVMIDASRKAREKMAAEKVIEITGNSPIELPEPSPVIENPLPQDDKGQGEGERIVEEKAGKTVSAFAILKTLKK